MDIDLIQATQTLSRGDTARIEQRPGATLLVVRGCVWLTRDSDPADYLLGAGESFPLEHSENLVATALEDSVYAVLESGHGGAAATNSLTGPSLIERHRLHAEAMRSRYIADSLGRILRRGAEYIRGLRRRLTGRGLQAPGRNLQA